MQEVLRTDASGLPIRQYMNWNAGLSEKGELARFDEVVALLDSEHCPELLPTGEMLLRLHWRPLSRTAGSLKSFVHAYGAFNAASGSSLWTQADQYPQGGRLDTVNWTRDEVFRDIYYLYTGSLADGTYEFRVGWYEPSSGRRLGLADGSDSFALCAVEFANTN